MAPDWREERLHGGKDWNRSVKGARRRLAGRWGVAQDCLGRTESQYSVGLRRLGDEEASEMHAIDAISSHASSVQWIDTDPNLLPAHVHAARSTGHCHTSLQATLIRTEDAAPPGPERAPFDGLGMPVQRQRVGGLCVHLRHS